MRYFFPSNKLTWFCWVLRVLKWINLQVRCCSKMLWHSSLPLHHELQSMINCIIKSYTIFINMGNLWNFFVGHHQMCLQSKSWALAHWTCHIVCDFHLPWIMWWTCKSNYTQQFEWFKRKCFWYAWLEEWMLCMKCWVLEMLLPCLFLHGFERKMCIFQ
jgi:hypothetical protein